LFRGVIATFLVGGAIAGYRLRVRGIEARSKELALQVEERAAELRQEIDQRMQVEEALRKNEMEKAVAAERSRLARELHDAVTQTLFSASLIAEVLPTLWKRDYNEGERRLSELRELTRGALAEMRTLLLELRPATLSEADLGDLVTQLAESITGRSRLPVSLDVNGECEIPSEVKIALYRITQEALNNVAKHSGANQAAVSLHCSSEQVRLCVRDNGRGFDPETIPVDSLGLGIMNERAEAIGASLEILSQDHQGTEVVVVWKDPTGGY
jgi:signal transduction histidine kinase